MKIYVDKNSSDYIEISEDRLGSVDLSIRTKTNSRKSIIVTAKVSSDSLDKLISGLVILKSRLSDEQE